MSRYTEQVDRYWGLPVPVHLKHGRATFACKVYGCDCKECLPSGKRLGRRGKPMTGRERRARSRANLLGKPVPPGVKHGMYAYHVYRCRCDECKLARREQKQRRVNRWRETARGHWHTEDDMDVIHWPPADLDEPWICPDCDFVANAGTVASRDDVQDRRLRQTDPSSRVVQRSLSEISALGRPLWGATDGTADTDRVA